MAEAYEPLSTMCPSEPLVRSRRLELPRAETPKRRARSRPVRPMAAR